MKRLFLLSLLFLSACGEEAVSTSSTNNPKVPVQLLFENDGCKVYRFKDGIRHHYYSDCRGQTMSSYSCGRNNTCDEEIPTSE